jgi:uncharacterized cupredoxin-like copper-binding protein
MGLRLDDRGVANLGHHTRHQVVEIVAVERPAAGIVGIGAEDHEFLLASTEGNLKHAAAMKNNPDMEHDDPNGVRLAPKKSAELLWKFSKPGTFEYSCLIPTHREYGMTGKVIVK